MDENYWDQDHLAEAQKVAAITESLGGSPDDRSIPMLLGGILHALVAIAEGQESRTP